MRADRCNRCRFWNEDMSARDPNDENFGFGQCRRKEPVLLQPLAMMLLPKLEFGQQVDPDLDVTSLTCASVWPATGATDWCGRYEPKGGGGPC
ncbi:MAG: hypothetical protein JWQ03_3082 [Variovorax sp.]|nr:hypothetical protein [Variovorax sp.]